jgi:predicted peptidase
VHALALSVALTAVLAAPSEGGKGRFVEHAVRLPSGEAARFVVWLPPHYSPEYAWPTVVFLHGQAESGTDNDRQTRVGLGPVLRSRPGLWPGIVVFPQKPEPEVLWSAREDLVLAALAQARGTYPIDAARIHLTGLSQGGEGTLAIGARHPRTFASLVAVCGWSEASEETARAIGSTPVWVFHGAKDDVVPPGAAQKIAGALKRAGHPPRLTIFPDAGHNSWDRAYRQKDLWRWLIRQRRSP